MVRRTLGILLLGAAMGACDHRELVTMDNTAEHTSAIQWYKGDVEDAFNQAKQENKPLFFYWGAEWCPPCQEIKNTVFKHPKFISQSQLFIPVYLDGDTEQAQLVGEQFSVQGYPTMVVFNSQGEEITRIPGGIDTRRYLDVLSLSINSGKQINHLLTQAAKSPESLGADELTQLAYYSWGQGNLALTDSESLAVLKSLAFADESSNPLATLRLLLIFLSQNLALEGEALSENEKQHVLNQIKFLLADQDRVLATIDYLCFDAANIVKLLDLPLAERDGLIRQWTESVKRERNNAVLSKAERLATLIPAIDFYWLQHPEENALPAEMAVSIRTMVDEMNKSTAGDERQSVINRSGNILRSAKLYDAAKELIGAELAISKSPYYFMSSLAEIAEETHQGDEAVTWRHKAYLAAVGKATRFQWGVEYVSALIEFQPQNTEVIKATALGLFDNLDQGSDVFSGRNFGRLKTLLAKVDAWESPDKTNVQSQLLNHVRELCEQTDGESPQYRQCNALLTSL